MALIVQSSHLLFFFFNDTATTEIYTLSLHDALPISATSPWTAGPPEFAGRSLSLHAEHTRLARRSPHGRTRLSGGAVRSEEHTSELQSRQYLVCRLLLEKKKIDI